MSELVGVLKFSELEACAVGQDIDESDGRSAFFEKGDPCLLVDPFAVSGLVKTELGAVKSVKVVTKSGL